MEAAKIWAARKSAFGAMGRINDYMCLTARCRLRAAICVETHIGTRQAAWPGMCERVSCWRRQHAPADPFDSARPAIWSGLKRLVRKS